MLLAFPFQLLSPGVGQLENATLIGPLLLGEADAAVTIARTGPGKCDPEQEPVRPLARAVASDGDIRHGAQRIVSMLGGCELLLS
jgi:hypothetical protein